MTTTQVLAEVLGILQGIGADPGYVRVEGSRFRAPSVEVSLNTLSDFRAFVAADGRPKITTRNQRQSHARTRIPSHIEYSALFDRPSRRMLLRHDCFPHCPDRGGDGQ